MERSSVQRSVSVGPSVAQQLLFEAMKAKELRLKKILEVLEQVCINLKRINQKSVEETENLFSCLDEYGHTLAGEEPLLGSCFEMMSSFSKTVEEIELNLQYDIMNKFVTPLSEFVNSQKNRIEHFNEELSRAISTEQIAKDNGDTSIPKPRKPISTASTKVAGTSIGLYEAALIEGRTLAIEGISSCFEAYHEFFSRGLQAVNTILPEVTSCRSISHQTRKASSAIPIVRCDHAPDSLENEQRTQEQSNVDKKDSLKRTNSIHAWTVGKKMEENNLSPHQSPPKRSSTLLEITQSPPKVHLKSSNWVSASNSTRARSGVIRNGSRKDFIPRVFTYETQKIDKARKARQKVLEVNLDKQQISSYHVKNQISTERPAVDLLQVRKSKVNNRKVKLIWRGREEKPEKYVFQSPELRERFIEATWALRAIINPAMNRQDKVSIWVGTWNLGNAVPPDSLASWLPKFKYDIIAIGTQECEYSPRKPYPTCEADWFGTVTNHIGEDYFKVGGISLLSIRMIIFARKEHFYKITRVIKSTKPTGIGGVIGNKGAIGMSFSFFDTKLCFVNSHLAAHAEKVDHRNNEWREMIRGLGNLTMGSSFDITNYFHHIFWFGDLNYRVEMSRDTALAKLSTKDIDALAENCQLSIEMKKGNVFNGFKEADVKFMPTYKFNKNDREYTAHKLRTPSWCDRVLVKSIKNCSLTIGSYDASHEIMTSDHSPVYATFHIEPISPMAPKFSVSCRIAFSQVRLKSDKLGSKGDVYTLCIESPILARAKTSLPVPAHDLIAKWSEDQLPELIPTVNNKDHLERQHLLVLVRDSLGEIGQGVIILKDAAGDFPIKFETTLFSRGLGVGSLSGLMQIIYADLEEEEARDKEENSNVVKKGFLIKQGGSRKTWKRRWFVLSVDGNLSYYNMANDDKPLKAISLLFASVAMNYSVAKQFCFSVDTPKRRFLICADNHIDMELWIDAIVKVQKTTHTRSSIL